MGCMIKAGTKKSVFGSTNLVASNIKAGVVVTVKQGNKVIYSVTGTRGPIVSPFNWASNGIILPSRWLGNPGGTVNQWVGNTTPSFDAAGYNRLDVQWLSLGYNNRRGIEGTLYVYGSNGRVITTVYLTSIIDPYIVSTSIDISAINENIYLNVYYHSQNDRDKETGRETRIQSVIAYA